MGEKSLRLANKVREFRAREGMTQEDLAERVGVTRQTIIAIEKGHYIPSLALGLAIARVFRVPTDELFLLTDS